MTPDRWMDCMALMAELWPHRPIEPGTADRWYWLLCDLPADDVEAAINRLALEPGREWPPGVGAIREAAEPPLPGWEDALAALRSLVARHGSYATLGGGERPRADDEALDAVIEAYGWQTVCSMDSTSPTVRAQFRDSYQAAQRRARDQVHRDLARQVTAGTVTALTGGGS